MIDKPWTGLSDYWPREPFRKFHTRQQRYAAMVCHRRAGKSVCCVADLVCSAVMTKLQDARYAYVAPLYVQAKDIAWMYLKRLTSDVPGVTLNESELRANFPNGAQVRLYGADNPDRLRGLYLDSAILDEFADMRPSVWGEIIRPMLMDRKGSVSFLGTPKGHNSFHEIWKQALANPHEWFSMMLKSSDSNLLDPDEIAAARKEMTVEQFNQELECSFEAAILGAYYGKEIAQAEREGRITDVPYDDAIPVHTAWDLGGGGGKGASSTAIWCFQVVNDEIHVIDHIEDQGHPLSHYVRILNDKPYKYGKDYLPHDARAKELISGRTRVEAMLAMRRDVQIVTNHLVADGINAVRLTLPRMWFDSYKCQDGIEALRQYQAEYDEKMKTFKDHPRPDWASHSADALRYLCMAYRETPHPEKRSDTRFRTEALSDGQILLHDMDDLDDLPVVRPRNSAYERIR